jgi:RNA polymerase sigma factor (sigma-70 family)
MASSLSLAPLPPSPLQLAPAVASSLLARGVDLGMRADEDPDSFGDRIDTALMALWRDSADQSVFEELYRHARGRVFVWLRWLLRGDRRRIDPLELLQDTFVNVYRYGEGFRDDCAGSFRAWVRTIAGNVLRRSTGRDTARRFADFSLQALPEGLQEPVDPDRGPHLRLVEGEERAELGSAWMLFLTHYAQAYAQLAPRDRRALDMVEVQGRSYAEAGRILAVSSSNMKMIMLRARRRLQGHLRRSLSWNAATVQAGLVRRTPARSRRA